MMTSIMQDKKNIHSRSSRITIRILAVAFWLLVWQIGSMWLGLYPWPGNYPNCW